MITSPLRALFLTHYGVLVGSKTRWLNRNLVILTLVSLLQDAASELMYPLLPILVTGVLAAPPVVLGLVEGTADATAGVTRYAAGRWSDRVGRKPFIGLGYSLAAIGKVFVAAAAVWPVVLIGRTVDRFGKGIRSAPRDALIADSVPRSALGRAFGFHRAGDSLGAVIGPFIALAVLGATNENIRAALWWAVIPAIASAVLVVFVRDTRRAEPQPEKHEKLEKQHGTLGVKRSPLSRQFWLVTSVLVIISLLNFSDALLLLHVLNLGFSLTQMVFAYILFNLVYTLGAYPAGALSDHWPRSRVYAIGLIAFAIGYVGLAVTTDGVWTYVLIAIYGLFPAFTDGVGKAWISSLVPEDLRGRAQGVFQMLTSGAILLAGLWAGLLWSLGAGAGTIPLAISGVGAAVAALILIARLHPWRSHL